ncbi:CBS domain-containing protein CBSX3 [Carex littledalei]|uniref:CBS domain-containing protein CBSX3 n=1 Tax=Carex littledalei TaxID=544730 RepID=A0A833RI79_9POAL|nr:CBS domain-containing protein CBSX3 [Carex littledalei]
MQGIAKAIGIHGNRLKKAVLQHMSTDNFSWTHLMTRFQTDLPNPRLPHKGLENITVAEILKVKGEDEAGSVYWCRTNDTVFDAVQHMTGHNVGALVVVKPGDEKIVAGIVTERDYLKKIVVEDRPSKETHVGEIMTDENKLVTVNSDTKILKAMELIADKHIRHVPVIDKRVVGMISIVDVVKVIVEQQHQEVKRLNDFIRGEYY